MRWGHSEEGWWFILKEMENVGLQRRLQEEDVVLEQVSPQEITYPTLSPDRKTVWSGVSKMTVFF